MFCVAFWNIVYNTREGKPGVRVGDETRLPQMTYFSLVTGEKVGIPSGPVLSVCCHPGN